MLEEFVAIREKKDDNEVIIYISRNCPLGLVHDALFKARSYVIEKINEAAKADAPKTVEVAQEEVKE